MNKTVFSKISKIAKQFDSKENRIQRQNGQYSYKTSNFTEISKLKKRPAHSVLIVDDNIEMCLMFKYFLYKKGFGVDTAGTGQDALKKLRNRFFNIVLLAGMERIELVPYFKEMYPDIGVIIIADCLETINAINLLNNEASYYLTKPVNLGKIADKVKEIIQKQRLAVIRNKLLEIGPLDLISLERNYKEKNRAYV
ncbi:MAG: response regulator [bacterium]